MIKFVSDLRLVGVVFTGYSGFRLLKVATITLTHNHVFVY
jgi:hypothetical protein